MIYLDKGPFVLAGFSHLTSNDLSDKGVAFKLRTGSVIAKKQKQNFSLDMTNLCCVIQTLQIFADMKVFMLYTLFILHYKEINNIVINHLHPQSVDP